jgi:hypothetical protein
VSAEAVEIVQRIQSPLVGRDVVAAFDDADAQRLLGETFGQYAHPDFEVSMIGPDYLPNTREARGTEGFGELWGDWTSAFATFRIEVEDVIDAGDAVVSLVRRSAPRRPAVRRSRPRPRRFGPSATACFGGWSSTCTATRPSVPRGWIRTRLPRSAQSSQAKQIERQLGRSRS